MSFLKKILTYFNINLIFNLFFLILLKTPPSSSYDLEKKFKALKEAAANKPPKVKFWSDELVASYNPLPITYNDWILLIAFFFLLALVKR